MVYIIIKYIFLSYFYLFIYVVHRECGNICRFLSTSCDLPDYDITYVFNTLKKEAKPVSFNPNKQYQRDISQ